MDKQIKMCFECALEPRTNGSYCKSCKHKHDKQYREKNKESLSLKKKELWKNNKQLLQADNKKYYENNKEEIKLLSIEYYHNNKETISEQRKQYRQENKEQIIESKKIYYQNNKEKIKNKAKQYKHKRRQEDLSFKLRENVSCDIRRALKNRKITKGGQSTWNNLPYSLDNLIDHLKSLFEPWMNSENYGTYNSSTWDDNDIAIWKWQIDHIIPHSDFEYISMSDPLFKECWALENLRPLSAKQNQYEGATKIRHRRNKKL